MGRRARREGSWTVTSQSPQEMKRRSVPRIGVRENHWSVESRAHPAAVLGKWVLRSFCDDYDDDEMRRKAVTGKGRRGVV
jgi:hypothetical protein